MWMSTHPLLSPTFDGRLSWTWKCQQNCEVAVSERIHVTSRGKKTGQRMKPIYLDMSHVLQKLSFIHRKAREIIIDRVALVKQGDYRFGSVRPSVRPFVMLSCLNRFTSRRFCPARIYPFAGHLKFSPDMSGETGGFNVLCVISYCLHDMACKKNFGEETYCRGPPPWHPDYDNISRHVLAVHNSCDCTTITCPQDNRFSLAARGKST